MTTPRKRFERTPAKDILATQLTAFREQVKALHQQQSATKTLLKETVAAQEVSALYSVLSHNRVIIRTLEQQIERIRQTLRNWDSRSHEHPTVSRKEQTVMTEQLAKERVDSLNSSIESKRSQLRKLSEEQRTLKQEKSTLKETEHSDAQLKFNANCKTLTQLQRTIQIMCEHYDRAHESWFQLTKA